MAIYPGRARWRWGEERGIESLPIVLLLSLLLALSTLSLGLAGMERIRRVEGREKALLGLHLFLEEVRALSFSHQGSEKEVELELGGGELLISGERVELWLGGERVGEGLPVLPLHPHQQRLRSGRYLLKLERKDEFRILLLPVSRS